LRHRVTQQNQQNSTTYALRRAFLRFVYGEKKIEDRRAEEDERKRVSFFPLRAALCFFFWERYNTERARETHFGRAAAPANEEKAHREEEEEEEEEERGERKLRG
jgi:hypothetical protein